MALGLSIRLIPSNYSEVLWGMTQNPGLTCTLTSGNHTISEYLQMVISASPLPAAHAAVCGFTGTP